MTKGIWEDVSIVCLGSGEAGGVLEGVTSADAQSSRYGPNLYPFCPRMRLRADVEMDYSAAAAEIGFR